LNRWMPEAGQFVLRVRYWILDRIEIVDEIDFILRNSDVIGTINWTVLWHDLSTPILDWGEIIFIYFPGFFVLYIHRFLCFIFSKCSF